MKLHWALSFISAVILGSCTSVPPPGTHLERPTLTVNHVSSWKHAWGKKKPLRRSKRERLLREGLNALTQVEARFERQEAGNGRDQLVATLEVAWALVAVLHSESRELDRGNDSKIRDPLAEEVEGRIKRVEQRADSVIALLDSVSRREVANEEFVHAVERMRQALRICPSAFCAEKRREVVQALDERVQAGLAVYREHYGKAKSEKRFVDASKWLARMRPLDRTAPDLVEWNSVNTLATDERGRGQLERAEAMYSSGRIREALELARSIKTMMIDNGPVISLIDKCNSSLASSELQRGLRLEKAGQFRAAVLAARRSREFKVLPDAVALERRAKPRAERRIVIFPIRNRCDGLRARKLESEFGGRLRKALRSGLGRDEWHAFVPDADLDRVLEQVRFNARGQDISEVLERLRKSSLTAHYAVNVEFSNYARNERKKMRSRYAACRLVRKRTKHRMETKCFWVAQYNAYGHPLRDMFGRHIYRQEPRRVRVPYEVYDYTRERYSVYRDRVDEWIDVSVTVYRFEPGRASEPFFRMTNDRIHGKWTKSYVEASVPLSELRELPPGGASLRGHEKLTGLVSLPSHQSLDARHGLIVQLGTIDDEISSWIDRACADAARNMVRNYR